MNVGVTATPFHETSQNTRKSCLSPPCKDATPKWSAVQHLYSIGNVLGSGAFAQVRIAKHKKSNTTYALKMIAKANKKNPNPPMAEYLMMKSIKHENVISVHGMHDTHNALYIEMEVANDGDLFAMLDPSGPGISERKARCVMRDLCLGLHYIHGKRIVHSDLKPENILIHNGRAKISDFGLSAHSGTKRIRPATGTGAYMPPELHGISQTEYIVELSQDIWALGIILYATFFADLPWEKACSETDVDYKKFLLSGGVTAELYPFGLLSSQVTTVLQRMLDPEPSVRPSMPELQDFFTKQRAWFKDDIDSVEAICDIYASPVKPQKERSSSLDMLYSIFDSTTVTDTRCDEACSSRQSSYASATSGGLLDTSQDDGSICSPQLLQNEPENEGFLAAALKVFNIF
eukprot:m.210226 g.210226  ORF g.210226 m.210226 type:complete len:404 (+) comp19001_c0_seq1:301-1512(+)